MIRSDVPRKVFLPRMDDEIVDIELEEILYDDDIKYIVPVTDDVLVSQES